MVPRIEVDTERCVCCHLCELVCSYRHFHSVSTSRSGIRITFTIFKDDVLVDARVCRHCDPPYCARACEYDAIVVNNGIVTILGDRCTGCGDCVKACPYGALRKVPNVKVPIKCDLCGGDPECVKVCPTGAIRYVSA
ncbi:MAG: 4Fe-4S dicluster domain-containing protein [Crenarchaeota archaeon]|nr:4Fe-4S dicluster domain-containing protein [Thermoproteota archaeon]